MERKVSFVIPVIREDRVNNCINAIKKYVGLPESDYEILTEVDKDRVGCAVMVKRLVEKSKFDFVCFLGDDTVPTEGFILNAFKAMETLPDQWGLVGLNDGTKTDHAAHWVAHKKMLDLLENREFFYTGYKHCFCDEELTDIAKKYNRFVWVEDAVIIHDHPILGADMGGEYSNIYKMNSDKDDWNKDEMLYMKRKIARTDFKLGVALPVTNNWVYTPFLISFIAMNKPDFVLLIPKFGGRIDAIRNDLVTQALMHGCTHLIFMDTDQVYPVDCIDKLLSHDKDFVSGVVHRRWRPFDPILYWKENPTNPSETGFVHVPLDLCYSDKLVRIHATGCGCMAIKTKVFFEIDRPWFKEHRTEENNVVGEDIDFCNKLRLKGINMYADTSVQISHLSLFEVTKGLHELFRGSIPQKTVWNPSQELYDEMTGCKGAGVVDDGLL